MNFLTRAGGAPALQPAKFHGHLRRGDVFIHETAGAGGWGDPLERDPGRVLRDVLNGFVSSRAAADQYGVALTPDGQLMPRRRRGCAPACAPGGAGAKRRSSCGRNRRRSERP